MGNKKTKEMKYYASILLFLFCYSLGFGQAKTIKVAGSGSTGSGTVNSGIGNRVAAYLSTGNAVSNLPAITANRAIISDANGLPVHSASTATEVGYLSGVTSSIQAQISARPDSNSITKIVLTSPANGDIPVYDGTIPGFKNAANLAYIKGGNFAIDRFTGRLGSKDSSWMALIQNDSNRLTINSRGFVGIGVDSASNPLEVQRVGNAATAAAVKIFGWSGATTGAGAYLKMGSSNGTTAGSLVTTTNNKNLAVFDLSGVNSSNVETVAARMIFTQKGTALTNVPTIGTFLTGGSIAAPSTALYIDTSRNIAVGSSAPDASAQLDVQSTTKSFLPPRMTAAQRLAIVSPANGSLVFDTDSLKYAYYSAGWVILSGVPVNVATIAVSASVSGTDVTTTSSTLSNVTGMQIAVLANKRYRVTIALRTGCDNTGGMLYALAGPAGSAILSGMWSGIGATSSTTPQINFTGAINTANSTGFNRVATNGAVTYTGYITTAGTAGNITLQYKSVTATQTSTIFIGSTMDITEVQ